MGPDRHRRRARRMPAWLAAAAAMLAGAPAWASQPFVLDREGRILAPVHVNGEGPFWLIVDTGASHVVLDPDINAAIAAPEIGQWRVRGMTGESHAPVVTLDSLTLDAVDVAPAPAALIAAPAMGRADGFLGMLAFAYKRVEIDFAAGALRVTDALEPLPDDTALLAATVTAAGLVVVTAEIDGLAVPAMIDTGAERTIINIPLAKALGLHRQSRLDRAEWGVEGVGHEAVTPAYPVRVERFRLGALDARRLRVMVSDVRSFQDWTDPDAPALILGMDVLSRAQALIIDYPREEAAVRA